MKGDLLQSKAAEKHGKRRRVWRNIVMAMAAVVVFCTVYALVLPAITLSEDPICAQAEHIHTQDCYKTESITPLCPASHWDGAVLHSHDESCYDKFGELICPLVELTAHIHSKACWENRDTLVCSFVEGQAHSHSEACFATEEKLSCTEDHDHGEGCYTQEQILLCDLPETAGHTHDSNCYQKQSQLVCQKRQVAMHSHDESCCNELGTVVCSIIPAQEHVHNADCFVATALERAVLACGLSEHSHIDSCYPSKTTSPDGEEYLCGMGLHGHRETCYVAEGNLSCTLPEHVHSAACLIADYDPKADVESAEDWEATLANVSLTGKWPQDILAVAKSQLGYAESSKNAVLGADGVLRGYTRYGDWYGSAYGDWCAMFVSFCLHYAGAETVPQDALCNTYIEALEEAGMYRLPEDYLPKPGDIVFFDWERTGGAYQDVDHVGFVTEIIRDSDGNPVKIKTIEGNSNARVQYREYAINTPIIVGYGDVPQGADRVCLCEIPAHSHDSACRDEVGKLVCGMQYHRHIESCYGQNLFYRDDQLQAQLTVRSDAQLPADLKLSLVTITEENDPKRYDSMSEALESAVEEDPYCIGDAGFYHVELSAGGKKYELPKNAEAVVDVTFAQPVFDPVDVAVGQGVYGYVLSSGKQDFEVTAADDGSYENTAAGLTGVRLALARESDFAVMLASTTQTGTFWTRVTGTSELDKNSTYMIVSAQGNYALKGSSTSTNSNYTAVLVETVKGNPQYYTIKARSGSVDNALYWTITPGNSNKFTVRNQNQSSYYLNLSSTSRVVYRSSANLTFEYVTPENCWRIKGSYYLRNQGTGAFASNNTSDGTSYSQAMYYSRDMLIFKLSSVTELTIPEDVESESSGSSGSLGGATKPYYDPFIAPSNEKSGETAYIDAQNPAIYVPGKYYSDKATSDIEKYFDMDDYALNAENDGKILADKSVIYMDDDYDAFSSYSANTFGITLSALGQEYEVSGDEAVRTPIDVVFVLDCSGSMTTNATDGTDQTRAQAMVSATNKAIKEIMDDHPGNRIGIVLYATGAWKLLPLDRYTATNDQYLRVNVITGKQQNDSSVNYTIHFVETSPSLMSEAGVPYGEIGTGFNQGYGTYTQAGIALGYETFEAVTDTTYTAYFDDDENGRSYTVTRQPVMILLSDGEPTHSTNIYMDPINGPHYGDGNGAADNGKGIHGYNTILSANYFKRMVGIHYDTQPLFFTVGMGINSVEEGDGPRVSTSKTGDNYKRAVLNPTKENIENLTSTLNPTTTTDQLRKMMLGTYTDVAVTVLSKWPDNWTGIPHTRIPVLQGNPYVDNYSYADDAFFGELGESALTEIFSTILQESIQSTPYGFILHSASAIEMEDRIGEGMELQGVPVLRFAGTNYRPTSVSTSGNQVRYTYTGTYTHPYLTQNTYNLSEIVVTVTTDENGNQTVRMHIPDTAIMAYTPETGSKQFYYEALPVRLIYQVGLNEAAKQQVAELAQTGGELTFYTNAWSENGGEAFATWYPSASNPYYHQIQESTGTTRYQAHRDQKEVGTHVSETLPYSVDSSMQQTVYNGETVTKVVEKFGNNGKLTFEMSVVEIPVEMEWSEESPPMPGMEIELKIYRVVPNQTGNDEVTLVDTIILNESNAWKSSFKTIPVLSEGYYAVVENVPEGYHAQYPGESVTLVIDQTSVSAAKVDLSAPEDIPVTVIVNVPEPTLPETGGTGMGLYYAFGALLLAAALVYIAGNGCLRRKEGE